MVEQKLGKSDNIAKLLLNCVIKFVQASIVKFWNVCCNSLDKTSNLRMNPLPIARFYHNLEISMCPYAKIMHNVDDYVSCKTFSGVLEL